MMRLTQNLKREEGGLENDRGFRPDSAIQTFEVYISPKVRAKSSIRFNST